LLDARVENEDGYVHDRDRLPQISVSASRDKAGAVHVSLCNLDPKATAEVALAFSGIDTIDHVSGQILTAEAMMAHNTFSRPEKVKPATFQSFASTDRHLAVSLDPMSVAVLEVGG
jgi:alpha-N-arabinofuranosidase